jgi:hypothetical protein
MSKKSKKRIKVSKNRKSNFSKIKPTDICGVIEKMITIILSLLRNGVEIDSEFLVRGFVPSLCFEIRINVDFFRFLKWERCPKYSLKILNLFFYHSLSELFSRPDFFGKKRMGRIFCYLPN